MPHPPISARARNARASVRLQLRIGFSILAAIASTSAAEVPETKNETKADVTIPRSAYVFKPLKILPSAVDGTYVGHFSFVNKGPKPVKVFGADEPDRGRFMPDFVKFEILADGLWKPVPILYCGTGAQQFAMKPKVAYEFVCDLSRLPEQEGPLTARIDASGFVSEPFVLDWKKDRATGAFAAARKENFKNVRAGFAKAGFKPELLEGDDFCERLLRSMLKPAGPDHGFATFEGKLDVTPNVEFNGNIRIDFKSNDGQYRGWWVINPGKFTPEWLRKIARNHVQAGKRGDHGLQMELDDGSSFWTPDNRLYLSINYVPDDPDKLPTIDQAKQTFAGILDTLDSWLKDR
jgi:hypothetical protein